MPALQALPGYRRERVKDGLLYTFNTSRSVMKHC
jgi:hypothetical protein